MIPSLQEAKYELENSYHCEAYNFESSANDQSSFLISWKN